jgi:hypothetical protein
MREKKNCLNRRWLFVEKKSIFNFRIKKYICECCCSNETRRQPDGNMIVSFPLYYYVRYETITIHTSFSYL